MKNNKHTQKSPSTKILVQPQDFSLAEQYAWLRSHATGAISLFSGLVRDIADSPEQQFLELEHYPGMTENQLSLIVDQALGRWQIQAALVIHRYGRLSPGEQIVMVGVGCAHRADAFSACEFITDYLKTDAPFWKKETLGNSAQWLQSQSSDTKRRQSWTNPTDETTNKRITTEASDTKRNE